MEILFTSFGEHNGISQGILTVFQQRRASFDLPQVPAPQKESTATARTPPRKAPFGISRFNAGPTSGCWAYLAGACAESGRWYKTGMLLYSAEGLIATLLASESRDLTSGIDSRHCVRKR
jgi:hypothetical protein